MAEKIEKDKILLSSALLGLSGLMGFQIGVSVEPKYKPIDEIIEAWKRLKVVIYGGSGTYERSPGNLDDPYVRVFYAEGGVALAGVEDLDPGAKPDGWTDVLLPTFYSIAPNWGNVTDRPIIFIDAAFGGAYRKDLYIYTKGKWRRVAVTGPGLGWRWFREDGGLVGGCVYIEYDLKTDTVYHPMGLYEQG